MPVYGYIVKWLHDNFKLRAFISLPEEIFSLTRMQKLAL